MEILVRQTEYARYPRKYTKGPEFTNGAKKVLKENSAAIYDLTGEETIKDEQRGGRPFVHVDGGRCLLESRSMRSQVAIFLDPTMFYVPNTEDKYLKEQVRLTEIDAEGLRDKLGLEDIDLIIPVAAATLTELTFKHLDATGVWLFGKNYGFLFARTKNGTNTSGSKVANVGMVPPIEGMVEGLVVNELSSGRGTKLVRVVRLVIPKMK